MSTETDRLAREAEAHRSQVDDTIERLKGRFSVGQIVDELSAYTRDGQGADMVRNLNRQVRDNPLALGIIGAGVAWLLLGQGVRSEGQRLKGRYDEWRGDDENRSNDENRTAAFDDYGRPLANRGSPPSPAGMGSYASDTYGSRSTSGSSYSGSYQFDRDRGGPGLMDRARGMASGIGSAASSVGSGVSSAGSALGSAAHSVGSAASGAASGIGSAASSAGSALGSAASGIGSAASSLGSAVSGAASTLSGAAQAVGDALSGAAQSAGSAFSSAGEALNRTGHDARDTAYAYGDAGWRGASGAGRAVGRYGSRARRTILDTLQDEPLVVGAVAIAIGAAIGASLPSTRTEDELLGETRDRLRDQAYDYGQEALNQAGHVASEAYKAGSEEAEKRGLMPTGEGGETIAERVSAVVGAAVGTARDEARKAVENATGGGEEAEGQSQDETVDQPGQGSSSERGDGNSQGLV